MDNNISSNKRIAKNTLFLYFRMFIIMGVTFYTTRVLLEVLGVDDFGIYNTIAGVVVLFAFLNNAMITTTQRFLNYYLGKDDKNMATACFSMSLVVHICIGIIVIVLAEAIGLWFLYNKMSLPPDRFNAAFWTLHLSIAVTFINIVKSPYNSCIIAYEKMDFFAFVSIAEAILKLLIVFLLSLASFDNLIFYCILLLAVTIIISYTYMHYCWKHYDISKFALFKDKKLFKELFSFSFYSLFGNAANVCAQQGVSLFINAFTSVAVNAAIGISNQLSHGIYSFITNFQIAFNPVLVKMYAQEDWINLKAMICRVSKISFFLMIVISLPILIYTSDYLHLWLKEVPEYSVSFCRYTILAFLVDTIAEPLWKTVQASGNIKTYQLVTSFIIISNLPIAYIILYNGYSPVYIFIAKFFINIIAYIYRAIFVECLINLGIMYYLRKVLLPIVATVLLIVIICILLYSLPVHYILSSVIMFLLSSAVILLVGLTSAERIQIITEVKKKIKM